jgi:hypothetical protein
MRERRRTTEFFSMTLANRKKGWRFNQSPLFLEFLMGKREYECTPWGNPTFNIFGWQKPCYLLQDGYADSFKELMETTVWSNYGTESGNPHCANCVVHSGYEASGVNYTFGSVKGLLQTAKAIFFSSYKDEDAKKLLVEWKPAQHGPLVKIAAPAAAGQGAANRESGDLQEVSGD